MNENPIWFGYVVGKLMNIFYSIGNNVHRNAKSANFSSYSVMLLWKLEKDISADLLKVKMQMSYNWRYLIAVVLVAEKC